MDFKPFDEYTNTREGITNPFQIADARGPLNIIQDGDGFIYTGSYVSDPTKVTLRQCIEVLTKKPITGRSMVISVPGRQMDLAYLDKTIAELLVSSTSYTILLDGSVDFFYRYVLTKEQELLSEDEQFELFEAYRAKFL